MPENRLYQKLTFLNKLKDQPAPNGAVPLDADTLNALSQGIYDIETQLIQIKEAFESLGGNGGASTGNSQSMFVEYSEHEPYARVDTKNGAPVSSNTFNSHMVSAEIDGETRIFDEDNEDDQAIIQAKILEIAQTMSEEEAAEYRKLIDPYGSTATVKYRLEYIHDTFGITPSIGAFIIMAIMDDFYGLGEKAGNAAQIFQRVYNDPKNEDASEAADLLIRDMEKNPAVFMGYLYSTMSTVALSLDDILARISAAEKWIEPIADVPIATLDQYGSITLQYIWHIPLTSYPLYKSSDVTVAKRRNYYLPQELMVRVVIAMVSDTNSYAELDVLLPHILPYSENAIPTSCPLKIHYIYEALSLNEAQEVSNIGNGNKAGFTYLQCNRNGQWHQFEGAGDNFQGDWSSTSDTNASDGRIDGMIDIDSQSPDLQMPNMHMRLGLMVVPYVSNDTISQLYADTLANNLYPVTWCTGYHLWTDEEGKILWNPD